MATVNGVVGTQVVSGKTTVVGEHPAVIRTLPFKADNGTLEAGTIVAINATGTYEGYDPDATEGSPLLTPVGVLTMAIDTTKDTVGNVLVHGTVVKASLLKLGSAAADADVIALETAVAVWAM